MRPGEVFLEGAYYFVIVIDVDIGYVLFLFSLFLRSFVAWALGIIRDVHRVLWTYIH